MTEVQSRIIKAFEATGKTQASFCSAANLSPSYLGSIRNGNSSRASSTAINAICNAHNISRRWLVTGEGEMFLPRANAKPESPATITLNGIDYVPASTVTEKPVEVVKEVVKEVPVEVPITAAQKDSLPYVLIKVREQGFFCGYMEFQNGTSVCLRECRKIGKFSNAECIPAVPTSGLCDPKNAVIFAPIYSQISLETQLVYPCTEKARLSLDSVPNTPLVPTSSRPNAYVAR